MAEEVTSGAIKRLTFFERTRKWLKLVEILSQQPVLLRNFTNKFSEPQRLVLRVIGRHKDVHRGPLIRRLQTVAVGSSNTEAVETQTGLVDDEHLTSPGTMLGIVAYTEQGACGFR